MDAGFEEIDHTADWEIKVWAPDFLSLLRVAANGMYSLMELELESSPAVNKTFLLPFEDAESTLVGFLSELLYYVDAEKIGFKHFSFHPRKNQLRVEATGYPIRSGRFDIKAVTYHKIKITNQKVGLTVRIVFDV